MSGRYVSFARRASYRCEYWRAPEQLVNSVFEIEHIYPRSLGGSDDDSNLAFACPCCNRRKSARATARDGLTGEEQFLFNPRTDRWIEHFRLDSDSGRIEGITAVGRATVVALDMNQPKQIGARLIWIGLR